MSSRHLGIVAASRRRGVGHQAPVSAIAAGPGVVAVGTARLDLCGSDINAVVWTSVDGIVWSRVPHDETSLHEGQTVDATAGGPGLVAVGWIGPVGGSNSDAAVWTSVDGIIWSRVAHDEALFGNVERRGRRVPCRAGHGRAAEPDRSFTVTADLKSQLADYGQYLRDHQESIDLFEITEPNAVPLTAGSEADFGLDPASDLEIVITPREEEDSMNLKPSTLLLLAAAAVVVMRNWSGRWLPMMLPSRVTAL